MLIESILSGRLQNIQNSAAITTSEQLLREISQGQGTLAGLPMSPGQAMRIITVYACVRIIAEGVAQLPVKIYEMLDNDGKREARNHPQWRMITKKPNRFQRHFEYFEQMTACAALRGNAYAFKNKTRNVVKEQIPIHPDRVKVEQDEDYNINYSVLMPNNKREDFGPSDIFHLKGLSFDGITGINPVQYAREGLALTAQAERHGAMFFGNASRVAGLLSNETPQGPEKVNDLKKAWNEAFGGDKKYGTAVLDGGWKWQQLALSNEDAQFLETRKFQRDEICALFLVPPHRVANLERATFSNIEHQDLEFVKYTLAPWLVRWKEAIDDDIINPIQQGKYFVDFVVDALLRGDTKTRYEAYASALQNEWMNKNEVRKIENKNPVPGGDEFRNPAINPQKDLTPNETTDEENDE